MNRRRFASGPAPINPNTLDLARYYIGDDQATGAITDLLGDGGLAPDLTGTGTVIASDLNGHKTISFDGVSDQFTAASGGYEFNGTDAFTIFTVFRIVSTASVGFLFHVGANNTVALWVNTDGTVACQPWFAGGNGATTALSTGVWYRGIFVFNGPATGNPNRLKAYINGVQDTLTFAGDIENIITAGANTTLGANVVTGQPFNGKMPEFGVGKTAWDETTVLGVDAYLKNLYGLS